jgi:hypothetical protein
MARDAGLPLALAAAVLPGLRGPPEHGLAPHAFAHGFMLIEVAHIDLLLTSHYLRCPGRPQRLALCPAGRQVDESGHTCVDLERRRRPAWIGLAECDPLT